MNWDDMIVFPVPGPPERRIILLLGSPPVRSLSSPGMPVGVLAAEAESPGGEDMNLREPSARKRYDIHSDTRIILYRIHPANIGERARIAPQNSEASAFTRRLEE